jgi:hypothetical protein
MENKTDLVVIIICSIAPLLVIIFVALQIVASIPNNSYVNEDILTLEYKLGKKVIIHLSEISEINQVNASDTLFQDLIRTNGLAFGTYRTGYFQNRKTGQKLYMFISGPQPLIMFKYQDIIYVIDDWEK